MTTVEVSREVANEFHLLHGEIAKLRADLAAAIKERDEARDICKQEKERGDHWHRSREYAMEAAEMFKERAEVAEAALKGLRKDYDLNNCRANKAEALLAKYRKVVEAAKEVVDRWDTPLWKDVPATAEYINRLRVVLSELEG